jgi:SHS2 domain-containing protein
MLDTVNKSFKQLLENYYKELQNAENNKSDVLIKEDSSYLKTRCELFGHLLEYYIQGILYQNNIKPEKSEIKELREAFDKLIKSYIALVESIGQHNIVLGKTKLEEIVRMDDVKQLLEHKHNNDEFLAQLYERIANEINDILTRVVKEDKGAIQESLLKEETDLKDIELALRRKISERVFMEFVDELLLGRLNRLLIEDRIKNADEELFETEMYKRLERIFEEYRASLKEFSNKLSKLVVR